MDSNECSSINFFSKKCYGKIVKNMIRDTTGTKGSRGHLFIIQMYLRIHHGVWTYDTIDNYLEIRKVL